MCVYENIQHTSAICEGGQPRTSLMHHPTLCQNPSVYECESSSFCESVPSKKNHIVLQSSSILSLTTYSNHAKARPRQASLYLSLPNSDHPISNELPLPIDTTKIPSTITTISHDHRGITFASPASRAASSPFPTSNSNFPPLSKCSPAKSSDRPRPPNVNL